MARTKDPHAATVKSWETRDRAKSDPESDKLGTWSPDGKWTPNSPEAVKRWSEGRGVLPGDVPVPFPVWTEADREFDPLLGKDFWVGKRPINPDQPAPRAKKVGIMKVPVDELIATQHVVTEASVIRSVAKARKGLSPYGIPIIVRHNGKSFIYDGHHRSSAAKVMGEKEVLAVVWEIPSQGRTLVRAHFE